MSNTGTMGWQAEQRLMAVLVVNHGKLVDEDAYLKLQKYMAVRYARSSVYKVVQQLVGRDLIYRRYEGTKCVEIGAAMRLEVAPWAMDELRRAIGNRRRRAVKGQTEHFPPTGWEAVPGQEKPVNNSQPQQNPPSKSDPVVEIDYRALADNLLIQVTEIITGSAEDSSALIEQITKERDAALASLRELEETSTHNQRESERQLRAAGQQLNEKDQTIEAQRRRAQAAERERDEYRKLVDQARQEMSKANALLQQGTEDNKKLLAQVEELTEKVATIRQEADLEAVLGPRGVHALQTVVKHTA